MSQPSSSQPGALYEIRYQEIFPWLILVRSLRVSLMARVLLLALVGVWLTQLGWSLIDSFFSSNAAQLQPITELNSSDSESGPLLVDPIAGFETSSKLGISRLSKYSERFSSGPLARSWHWLTSPFVRSTSQKISWGQCLVLMVCGTWALAVWAVFGGAITRIAALQLTRGETIGPLEALHHSILHAGAIAGGPLLSLIAAAALALPLAFLGFLMRLDFFALLGGLLWLTALGWGLLLAVVLLGLLLGWPLMWATIGVERSDAFDSVSRCYAYIYQRPLHLVFYLLVASVLGLLGELALHYFATAGVQLTDWTVSWGAGNTRMVQLTMPDSPAAEEIGGMAKFGAAAADFWKSGLLSVAASYPLGFLWSATVGIYLLLRHRIDSTEMDEVSLDGQEPTEGLPKLREDESGVPQVEPEGSSE